MFVCWSVKGGSGTSVVAACLALELARSRPAVLVDLGGDAPAVLGLAQPAGPGVGDWMASPTAGADALAGLCIEASATMQLMPVGSQLGPSGEARWLALAAALLGLTADVVVDAGTGAPPPALLAAADQALLVIRPCYVAIRRAVAASARPTGIVLVNEPGRALTARDVELAVGAPVVAEVPYDPAIFRAVDAGLLASRVPRTITHPLRRAA